MKLLKSPAPTPKFLVYHFGGWLIFALVNSISRGLLTDENFEQLAIHALTLILTCGALTLIIREMIYRFDLLDKNWRQQWPYFFLSSISLAFTCAYISVIFLFSYYNLMGYAIPESIWHNVLGNWLIMTILLVSWTLIYVTAVNQDRLLKAEQEAIQLNLQLNEVKMAALMGQLNPHFLFNGLNNIRALILEDATKSRTMLTNLSDLLRYTLMAHKQKTVPLRDELEIVCQYIDLLKIQYEDRLTFKLITDPELMGERIPPLIIQLLTENAIRHGIEKSKHGGEVTIKVSHEEEHLVITVANPGTLELNAPIETKPSKKKNENTGLGLANIQKRLTLQYGNNTSFQIKQQGQQVIAQCHIPTSSLQLAV
ncbi:sensor histidine kinase [Microbulbifer sp. CNSA002]|uniref:sensor histidine kinase n=1 Tax=Microbulbifer sp. CNSA002 TaxID=3373604 RepID=UPI0039B6B5E6